VKRYGDLGDQTVAAVRAYADDVRNGRFPPRHRRAPVPALALAEGEAE